MFNQIFEHKILSSTSNVTVVGVNKQVQAAYVWNLFSVSKKSLLVVTDTLFEANELYHPFSSNEDVLIFPMDDFIASEAVAASPDLLVQRLDTLNTLLNSSNKIVITNMMGYERQSLVTKTGEYANRGVILDIFPYGFENPVRIEFFDNVIDEIRSFNPDTQTSISKLDNVLIEPFTEFINELSKDVPNR